MSDAIENLVNAMIVSAAILAVLIALALLVRRIANRNNIVFEPWMDFSASSSSLLGDSVADLLLFKIRQIRTTHERTRADYDLANPRDVPPFEQGLDENLNLLASVNLGPAPGAVAGLLVFLMKTFPFLSPRAHLSGSVHRYDDHYRLLAVLEGYKVPGSKKRVTRLWDVGDQTGTSTIEDLAEQLAYEIYRDLLGENLFKTWKCFSLYTRALRRYLDYMDLRRSDDFSAGVQMLTDALKEEPQNAVLLYNLGVLKYNQFNVEQNEEALDHFWGAIQTAPGPLLNARSLSGYSNALLQKFSRFYDRDPSYVTTALQCAKDAVRLAPDLDAAHKALGFANQQYAEYLHAENPEQRERVDAFREAAIRAYRKATKLNGRHFSAYNNMANLRLEWAKALPDGDAKRSEQLREAEKACKAALTINPAHQMVHDNLGNIHAAEGDFSAARREFEVAIRYRPGYLEARTDLASLYLDEEFLRLAVEADPDAHKSWKSSLGSHAQVLEDVAAAHDDGRAAHTQEARHRAKLCQMFADRGRGLQAAGRLARGEVSDELWARLRSVGCHCYRLVDQSRSE